MIRHPGHRPTTILSALGAACLFATGCGPTQPASFRLNFPEAVRPVRDGLDKSQQPWLTWDEKRQRHVAAILEAMFGTPDEPVVLPETGLDEAKIRLAAGPVRSDLDGRKNGLYREHCAHCHGVSGDGMGPTAAFLNPYPRDYRPGIFKFKSTLRNDKPTHADLVKILHDGIVGTSMPSFALLSPTQVDALAEYVKYLAIRGETELKLYEYVDQELGDEDELPESREFLVDEILVPVADKWRTTVEIPVAPVPEGIDFALGADHVGNKLSIARGRELFLGKGICVQCHGLTGLGDGQANDYDEWNKSVVEARKKIADALEKARDESTNVSPENLAEHKAWIEWLERRMHVLETDALAPRTIPPRNLRLGLYRGGRRPLDIYRRLYTGINGGPMPSAGPSSPGGTGSVPDEDIWHIVNYVLSLPYEFDGELGADRVMAAKDRF